MYNVHCTSFIYYYYYVLFFNWYKSVPNTISNSFPNYYEREADHKQTQTHLYAHFHTKSADPGAC